MSILGPQKQNPVGFFWNQQQRIWQNLLESNEKKISIWQYQSSNIQGRQKIRPLLTELILTFWPIWAQKRGFTEFLRVFFSCQNFVRIILGIRRPLFSDIFDFKVRNNHKNQYFCPILALYICHFGAKKSISELFQSFQSCFGVQDSFRHRFFP